MNTDVYELTHNTWNTIERDADNGYTNEANFKMDNTSQSYVEQSCLFLGFAGSGKSKILQETQSILTNNEVFRLVQTACPTHNACKIVNGITLHRSFNVTPIDFFAICSLLCLLCNLCPSVLSSVPFCALLRLSVPSPAKTKNVVFA